MVTENGTQSDGNTSFLRAARAGNLEKVLEHLKNNIDINTCNANGLNALHLASKDGHVAVVTELLARGATVDAATKKGNTALHIASLAGQEDVVKLLIKHNASVNVQSQNGFTPLYMAAQENHDSVVRLLLSNGANQSLATEDGFTPLAVAMQQGHDKVVAVLLESDTRGKVRLPALHIAAKKDDVKAATLLLENDHNPDVTSKSGFTPLHIASHYGNEAMANLLIQKGADVNYAAKHNISPLHVAAKWGKTNMVALLLEKGASIESKTRDGLTPLHCAARSGHEQVVDMLLERGAPISSKTKNGLAPLHMAAQGEHVDAARILLYHRAPVDEVTVDYLTALHVAAHCGHVRVAKLLLDRNADANARALNGFTPLHIACKKNRIKVVELLLKHGASISATTESGLTPLHVASFMGCMNIVIYLLQHDASPDVPTVRGETPLHLAARANQTDIIRILLRNGAQVDARAREQQTPLHIASRLGNVDIVMLLLQHGAQVDAVTKDMYTALHIAAKEGQDEVAAVLLNNGAQIDATTKKGFTPLHLTAKYGHMKVAELLLEKSAPVDAQGKNGVTPLHVASHYDHQNVAMLLLEKGASPHATAKNGHTPLHIAARKNQIDIANTLLKYEAQANAESKAGFTPLHLSAQEGHTEMSGLLLESKANPDHQARNGLTPMHLCAQEDRVSVAQVLVKHGANLQAATKAGYTPLHVASHFGQANMVRYLIEQQVDVNASTGIGYTPLHQASQQGHCHIVNILLESNADPNAITNNGQTSLKIAQKLGYISVLDSLKSVTDAKATPDQPPSEEKYRVVAPEAMHETFMSDSEEEGGEDTVLSDQPYRYLTVDEMKSLGDDSLPIDVTRDERMDSNKMVQSTDSHQFPPTALEDSISPQHASMVQSGISATDFTDNINIERHSHVGKLHWKNFLVSFLVDARGGAMRGCRHSGVRIIVPARSAAQPTRITCRYVKPQRTMHPPPLMEGEALASRVLELGPVGAKFLGPVIMEVPHFASLRGKEREIVILRSDNGETWREHNIDMSDEIIHDVLNECFEPEELAQLDELGGGRICRFVTYDFPQYFAVISRIRQEVHAIGPEGGMVSSTVVPQVQAVFPQGALTKKIKVGLQAQPIDPDLTAKLLGRGVAVSPVVTVEPRRRKFHKAITLSMPAPRAHSQGMINQYSGSAPTLRLLCSITGGTTRAQWEDVTGSTPLTFVNDCVSFTTTVSARFWLMDCRNIADATKMATELYKEAIHVPFMAKFVVFAKRTDPLEARLRVFCMTDDREDKTLEHQEHFTEVAKSRDVEVLEDKPQYIELAGNLVPVTKSGEQLALPFKAFRENRLPFAVRVKDQHADIVGRTLFMREPKIAKGEPPQQPICILNIVLPETIIPEQTTTITDSHEIMLRVGRVRAVVPPRQLVDDQNYLGELRIVDISNLLGEDWIRLAPEIGVSETDVENIVAQIPASTAQQAQAMLKQFQSKPNNDFNILENGLRTIHRDDIVERCIRSATTTGTTTTVTMRNKTSFSIGKRSVEAVELLSETDSIAKMAQKEDRLSKQESTKYSAEEKTVEESEESEEEMVKKTVAERRKQIEKRLSADRSIPASTQKREIVEEIITIKRQSVIDDTRAKHEEEILLQKPIDNTYKSSTMPEPVVKLKTTVVKDGPGVRKDEFEQELQDKFKVTLKNVEEFEHRSEVLEQLATEATSVSASSPRVVEEIKKKVEERVPAALDEPTEPAEQQPVESAVPPVPKERAPVPAKRTSLTKEPEEFQGVVEESIKDVKQRISSFETKSKTESLVDSKQSSVDTTSGRDSWSDDHRQASKRTDSEQISEDSEQEPLLRRDEHSSVQRTVGESSVVTTTQQAFTTVEQLERHDVSHAVEEKRESLLEAFGAADAGPAQWKEPDSEPSSLSEATGSSTSRREESISQHFKSETVSKVEETVTKMSTTVETKTVAGLPGGLDAFTLGKGDETIVREEFVARSAASSSIVDRTVESVVREVRDQEPAVEKRDMHREVQETADKMAALSSVETVQIGEGTAPQVSTAAAYTVERFEGLQSEVVSQDAAGMVAERTGTAVSSVETGVSQGEDTVSEKIVEREEEVRRRVEENVSIDKPVVQETVARTVTQEVTSKIPVPSKKSSPEAKDQPPMPAAQPTDGEPSAVDRMEAADQPKQTIEQQQAELSSRAEEMIETVVEHAESVASRIPRFGTTKPAAPKSEAVVAAKSPEPDTSSLSKIPVLKDRKVSEQFSSDSCETVIVQRSVEELQPHAEQVTASETVPDREYDEEIMSATAYGSERTVTEIITEDHRAVTPDDFIDEIIDEAQDKVQRQLQSAEVTVGTLDLSHSEEESFDKSAYPMQEYISRPGGGSGFDANATIDDDDEDEEAEREREKWKEDANSSVPDDMSTTDFEAFREYHWLDTPDAAGPAGQRYGLARTSTPIRDATVAAGVTLASLEDLDTLSPLSAGEASDGRKLALPEEAGSGTGDVGGTIDASASAVRSSRKHFNLDLDMDVTSTKTTTTATSTTTATKARKTTTFEKSFKPESHSNRGTSPMDEVVESPDSVHSARFGRGESPAIRLVIGRKEIKTSDTSAITESRLTVYGHKDVEISISSQSTISLTTTHTSKDGRDKTTEVSSSGGEVKEVSSGKRYKQFKLVDDPDSEQTERKRDEAVSFSKKKSVYLFGSFDSSSGSPITETSVSQHVTDTGISLTRGFTETMTSPGVISSSVEEKNKKVSIITDTAVDVEIEELELTDAGLSPILPDEADVTADFQLAEEDVHFAHTGTSPMDFEEHSVSAALDTSEAATLTDRVETKDASNSPLDVHITSILKRDVSKLTDEELLTGRRGSGDVKAKIKMLEQSSKAHSAQSSPKKKVEFEEHQLKHDRQDSPKRQKTSGKITELRKIFGEEEEPVESNVMSESIPPIQEVIKQLEKRIAVKQVESSARAEVFTKRSEVDVEDLTSQIIPVKVSEPQEPMVEKDQQISKLVRGVQSLGMREQSTKQLEQERRNVELRAAIDEPVCEKLAERKIVTDLVKDELDSEDNELRKTNDLIKMFEMKRTTSEEAIKASPKRKQLSAVSQKMSTTYLAPMVCDKDKPTEKIDEVDFVKVETSGQVNTFNDDQPPVTNLSAAPECVIDEEYRMKNIQELKARFETMQEANQTYIKTQSQEKPSSTKHTATAISYETITHQKPQLGDATKTRTKREICKLDNNIIKQFETTEWSATEQHQEPIEKQEKYNEFDKAQENTKQAQDVQRETTFNNAHILKTQTTAALTQSSVMTKQKLIKTEILAELEQSKMEHDEQPEPSEPVSEVVEKELTEDTELVEAKVIETVVEKVEAKPDDKPEQDEQPEPSEPVSEVVEKEEKTGDKRKQDLHSKFLPEVVEDISSDKDSSVVGDRGIFSYLLSPDRHEISDGSGSSEKGDDKFLLRRDELSVFDTRKSSLSAVEVSTLDDDSPLLTDFTTSSITYVSDRIDSSSLDLMVGEQSMNFLKIGSSMAPPDEKRHDIQSPGSCMSFTTTTSENIESISHDVESRSNFGGTLQPDIPTEYERSVSLSDNAASDYSNESATKYNLPYDTESDGHDAGAHKARLRGIKSQEGIAEPKQVKSAKLIAVDQRHGSASPQSDITEYTESVSYVDSIIDSTNYESALKQKETKQELRSKETSKDSCEADVKPSTVAADRETKASKLDTTAKPSSESVESAHPKRRSKSKTTVTKVNLHKQAPIDISKRSTKTVDIRMGAAESTVTVSKSATTSSRISTTATRTHGYMQSTLSRDQKVLRPLTLTDSPHSSPSKTSHRAGTASITSTHTTYSPAHSTERKATKPSKPGSAATPGVPEGATGSTKHGVSSTGARKIEVKESKFTTKSATGRSSSTVVTTSSTVSTSSTSSQSRLSRSSVTSSARKASTKSDFKEQPVVKKADKEQANLVTKSTLPAAVKTSKDRVNKSLIPVKVQSSKRDATPSPTKTASKSKPKSAPGPKPKGELRMSKPIAGSERTATKKEHSVQLITKSIPKVTSTVHRKESAKQIIDDVYRCKSAMHYSYKDAVTFDHAEVPSSLPSSPSRLNKSSSNSTNVLTSEVFTRTIDSSKSIEVIYKQPSTSHELYRRVQGEYNRYNDADLNFIETTDSSLSDSIALPSSSSEQESDATGKQRRSGSPEGSPKQTSSSSAVTTTMTTLAGRKNLPQHYPHHPVHQHVATKHGSSGSSASGKRARTHSPAEPRYRKSDIWSRTDPPASSQELPDTSEDSDSYYYHHQQHCLFQQQQQHQQHQQLPPVAGIADRRLTVSLDGIVLESSISPILDFRASTPPRMKYKFDYDSSVFPDTYTEHDDAKPTSTRSEGEDDGYLVLVRSEAGRLVDDVLEQSVSIVSSSQGPGPMTIDRGLQQPSESEQYAIRSDILSSTDGDLVVKSPTIESMSGKSFDDNMSNPEYDALLLGTAGFGAPATGADGGQPMSRALGADDTAAEDEGSDAKLTADGADTVATATKDQAAESARRAKKIDRKYARLSADLGPEALLDKNQEYDEAISQIKDEVSMLQSEYSKMSWDESVSMTTGDFGSSTPDNDLQGEIAFDDVKETSKERMQSKSTEKEE